MAFMHSEIMDSKDFRKAYKEQEKKKKELLKQVEFAKRKIRSTLLVLDGIWEPNGLFDELKFYEQVVGKCEEYIKYGVLE